VEMRAREAEDYLVSPSHLLYPAKDVCLEEMDKQWHEKKVWVTLDARGLQKFMIDPSKRSGEACW